MYSTDDVAKAARTTVRAVQLWDLHNLFGIVERDGNGARVFTEEHLRRAQIISAAQMAGMTLAEIKANKELEIWRRIESASSFMKRTEQLIVDHHRAQKKTFDL